MASQGKSRGVYASGQSTKESILIAATELFGEKGYYGSSLRDVAKIVGISHPAVIYHFPTKEALLVAAVDRWTQIFRAGNDYLLTNSRQVGATDLIQALMHFTSRPDCWSLARFDAAVATEAGSDNHPLHEFFKERFAIVQAHITHQIEEYAAAGLAQPRLSPATIASVLLNQWYGGILVQDLDEKDGQALIGRTLRLGIHLMNLNSDGLLMLSGTVPEDMAGFFMVAMNNGSKSE